MAETARILVADDNVETVRLIGLVLKREGYELIAARDGDQALALARRERPDLIVLDIMMPGMDGLEVARRLRADPEMASIPIMMFTAKAGLGDELKGFEAGADDYVTKMALPAELTARVRALLSRSSRSQQGRLIGVLGVKGGLGTTTVALNLGVALHELRKQDVVVADFRPGQGSLALTLGYTDPPGLGHLLKQSVGEISARLIENALERHRSGVSLLLASYKPTDARLVTEIAHYKAIVRLLPQVARFVLLDLPPALPPISTESLEACDEILVVVEPVPHSIAVAKALTGDLAALGIATAKVHFVLVNRGGTSIQLSLPDVEARLERDLAAVISPAAEMAYQAALGKQPLITVHPESLVAQQFNGLAQFIVRRAGQ